MQTNSINRNHTTSILSSFICSLILVIMLGCSKKNQEEEKILTPITQSMIDIVESQPGTGIPFLANVLKKLQAGESVDINAKDADSEDYTALHHAAAIGIPSVLQALIDRKADVNAKGENDITPLMVATQFNKPNAIAKLLIAPAIDINASLIGTIAPGATVLHFACQFGHKEIVKLLLADNRIEINKKMANGSTPLALAKSQGNTEIEKLLKEKGAV